MTVKCRAQNKFWTCLVVLTGQTNFSSVMSHFWPVKILKIPILKNFFNKPKISPQGSFILIFTTYVGCDFACKHFQFLKKTLKALSTRTRIFSKREVFSPYLEKFEKSASHFVTTSCWDILWFNCLCFPEIKQIIFFQLIVWKPLRDQSKWPPNTSFVQTNCHLGRTLSGDRPLFWALKRTTMVFGLGANDKCYGGFDACANNRMLVEVQLRVEMSILFYT